MPKTVLIVRVTMMLAAVACIGASAYWRGAGNNAAGSVAFRIGIGFVIAGLVTRWVQRPIQWMGVATAFFAVVVAQYAAYYFGYAAVTHSGVGSAYGYLALAVVLAGLSIWRLRAPDAPRN
jgi:hypothetical protein